MWCEVVSTNSFSIRYLTFLNIKDFYYIMQKAKTLSPNEVLETPFTGKPHGKGFTL